MAMLGQSSFRRILLLRILLLTMPILFLGMAGTFRKAKSSLLYTAEQNLTESAIRKAETIENSIQSLQTNLAVASELPALQTGSPVLSETVLRALQQQMSTASEPLASSIGHLSAQVRCLQLRDLQTQRVVVSTCGNRVLLQASTKNWAKQRDLGDANRLNSHTLAVDSLGVPGQTPQESQLNLIIATPVYNRSGQLRYSLTAQTTLQQMESARPGSFLGNTVIIDEKGTFVAHPDPEWLRRNISQDAGGTSFREILNTVRRGESKGRELSSFAGDNTAWLVGFSPATIPTATNDPQTWAVLAVTTQNNALQSLHDITEVLVVLTVGLLAAHLLAMLYMARDLALPIEQLGQYALRIHRRDRLERVPKNFKIRELNNLAEVLDNMVGRLEERAKELESAWKEAEAANQLKSEFLANTSHELRTPLNAIIGCIRLVKDDCCDTPEEETEFLEQADKAAVHLLKIINDLLDIQRIEAEKLPLSIELVDLRQILKEVVDLETVQIQQKGLQLTVSELPAPVMVYADSARLKQVLLNVMYNAIKFTDRGGISLHTRFETAIEPVSQHRNGDQRGQSPKPSQTLWAVIAIKDTGIGIDPAQQHKLFRPFVMVDGTTTRKFEGTGLGLAISRNLIELMNGRISLHSAGLDQGTTVEVMLPIVEPAVAVPPPPLAAEPNGSKSSVEPSTIG